MIAVVGRNCNRCRAAIAHSGGSRGNGAASRGGCDNLVLINRKYRTNGVIFRHIREGIAGHRRYAFTIHKQAVKVIALVWRNRVNQ